MPPESFESYTLSQSDSKVLGLMPLTDCLPSIIARLWEALLDLLFHLKEVRKQVILIGSVSEHLSYFPHENDLVLLSPQQSLRFSF